MSIRGNEFSLAAFWGLLGIAMALTAGAEAAEPKPAEAARSMEATKPRRISRREKALAMPAFSAQSDAACRRAFSALRRHMLSIKRHAEAFFFRFKCPPAQSALSPAATRLRNSFDRAPPKRPLKRAQSAPPA